MLDLTKAPRDDTLWDWPRLLAECQQEMNDCRCTLVLSYRGEIAATYRYADLERLTARDLLGDLIRYLIHTGRAAEYLLPAPGESPERLSRKAAAPRD